MMLTSDAFLGGAGEMERLRASGLAQGASLKANNEPQGASGTESFPEVLQGIQNAADSSGVSGTAAEAAETGPVFDRAPIVAEEKDSGQAIEAAALGKGRPEEEPGAENAAADALYARLIGEDAANVAVDAPIAPNEDGARLEAAEGGSLSSIIMEIAADTDGAIDDYRLAAAGTGSEALDPAALDERGAAAKSARGDAALVGAERSALDANLSSINMENNGTAVAAGEAVEAAFAESGEAARAGEARPPRASLAQESARNVAAAGQGKAEAQEDAAGIAVADFRTEARPSAERLKTLRNAEPVANNAETVALANSQGADSAQLDAGGSFEGDGLLGKEGFSSSGLSLSGARSSEGAAGSGSVAGPSFAERLASELRNNAADIVRAGQVVLRNGGEGTIRLALHPETLGAVRIHLEMTGEKKIAGRITVASREAWDAFSDSMDSLVAAFSDEGFDTAAGFDLSWAGRGAGGEDGGKVSAPFYASAVPDVMPADEFADDYSTAAAQRSRGSLYSVDLLA